MTGDWWPIIEGWQSRVVVSQCSEWRRAERDTAWLAGAWCGRPVLLSAVWAGWVGRTSALLATAVLLTTLDSLSSLQYSLNTINFLTTSPRTTHHTQQLKRRNDYQRCGRGEDSWKIASQDLKVTSQCSAALLSYHIMFYPWHLRKTEAISSREYQD